jgi:hypothetical protein
VPSKAKAKLRVDSSKNEGRGDDALNPHQQHESDGEEQQVGARHGGQTGEYSAASCCCCTATWWP